MKIIREIALILVFLSNPVHGQSADTDPEARWNVLLITVDNLRPDRMSVYGYERETTPYLKQFASESAVFDNAFSTSSWTAPGMVSIFTGYYPPVHAQHGRFSFYDEEMVAAFRVLADSGYEIMGQSIWGPSHEGFGFQKALSDWPDRDLEDFVAERTLEDPPFFAWAHIKDVHLPYDPSEENGRKFGVTENLSESVQAVREHRIILRYPELVDIEYEHAGKVQFSDHDKRMVQNLYDAEVADVDQRLKRNLENMRKSGLLDRTIVILSADHGEELFDHGWLGHASTGYDAKLFDELIRIPLIIRFPDQSLKGRFDALVQGVDFMPTIFELLKIESGGMQPLMQGRSMLPVLKGETDRIRDFVFNQTTLKGWTTPRDEMRLRLVSVRSNDKKLVLAPTNNGYRKEGYDLNQDPKELTNIYPGRKAEFGALEKALQTWMEDNRSRAAMLVGNAGEKRLRLITAAVLDENDIGLAVENWSRIQTMESTWGLEPDPFFDHERHRPVWRGVQSRAAQMIGTAMLCRANSGKILTRKPESPEDTASWYCEPGAE